VGVFAAAAGLWPGGWNEGKLGADEAGVLDFDGGWNEKLGNCGGNCGGASLEGGNSDGIGGLPNGDSPNTPVEGFYHGRDSKAARSYQRHD